MATKQTTVGYGSTVTVRREFTTASQTFHISSYTDLSRGIVSPEHPIGKGLLHHVTGEKVLIDDPKHYFYLEILEIKN